MGCGAGCGVGGTARGGVAGVCETAGRAGTAAGGCAGGTGSRGGVGVWVGTVARDVGGAGATTGSERVGAGGAAAGDGGAPSRAICVTRERSSSISFSWDSTTRSSVSSRVRVLRADTHAAIGRTKGMPSRISAKNRISTVPLHQAIAVEPPGRNSFVAGGFQPSYTDARSLVSFPVVDVGRRREEP